jgi:isocitrate lyase
VQGATVPIKSLRETLKAAAEGGSSNLLAVRAEWIRKAKLKTYDEPVKAIANEDEYVVYLFKIGTSIKSLKNRAAIATETVSEEVLFDWDLPRSREGQFFYKSCVAGIVEPALPAAPVGDVSWARMSAPSWADIVSFHK